MLGELKLSPRQERVLRRLCETPDYVSFRGRSRQAAYRLSLLGLARAVANDKWDGVIYQATPSGRDWVAANAR